MKKIGFIDHYIDEWHANNYPNWIRNSSRKDQFELRLAWQEATPPGKRSLEEWCREFAMQPAASAAQVVEQSDCLIVLSPDNPERHEDLCDLPLRSGKPVYVDKTFAPDLATAKRLFEKAEQHRTPMYSSSALRYVEKLESAVREIGRQRVKFVATRGPGEWSNYSVHQLEPLVMLLGTGAFRVRHVGNEQARVLVVDYRDGRRGLLTQTADHPFGFSAQYADRAVTIDDVGDFFPRFIEAMLAFFETRQAPVPKKQTLEIMALLEAGGQAIAARDKWVKVPR
jgi:hypothetical protein